MKEKTWWPERQEENHETVVTQKPMARRFRKYKWLTVSHAENRSS